MSFEVDDIEDHDDLVRALQILNSRIDGLSNTQAALEDTVAELDARVDDIEQEVTMTKASVPDQSRSKLDNVVAVVRFAYDKHGGQQPGVKVDSGEVTATIDGTKQTALRLMDEIGGKFDWATVENPGGPNPKVLKLKTRVPIEDRLEEVADRYAG